MIDHPPALIDCSKHNLKLMNVHPFKIIIFVIQNVKYGIHKKRYESS
jgi:hypothetical protein